MARRYRPYTTRKTPVKKYVAGAVILLVAGLAVFFGIRHFRSEPQAAQAQVPVTGPEADEEILTPGSRSETSISRDFTESIKPDSGSDVEDLAETEAAEVEAEPTVSDAESVIEETPEIEPEAVEVVEQAAAGPVTSENASRMILSAKRDVDTGDVIAARDKLNSVLSMQLSDSDETAVKKILERLSEKWLFGKKHYPADSLTVLYQVRPGDYLSTIGSRYKVPYELIMQINDIADARLLRAGQEIKIPKGPFHAVVDRSDFTMDIYLGKNTYVKTYRIGLGEAGKETPLGRWRVKSNGKLVRPPWPRPQELGGGLVHPDDPEYPLGSRWIGIEGIDENTSKREGFGIHGTKDPHTIGTNSSMGCIRLHNGDAQEVYDLMTPGMSEIVVKE